jgi:hypothetical protein
MICDPQTQRDSLFPTLYNELRCYPDHLCGDGYLIIDVGGNPLGGTSHAYLWSVLSSGKDPTATFSKLPGLPFIYTLKSRIDERGVELSREVTN